MHPSCDISERTYPTGNALYTVTHKPTETLIGVCMSREAAEGLIKAGAHFVNWDTITLDEAMAIKGGRQLLEHFAAVYGVTPIQPFEGATRPLWVTGDDLARLEKLEPANPAPQIMEGQ